ncbi:YXWGXW repeat-containing protein [Neorhizobium alkalisoli]|uniref:YXWGXW repeat-containing protein n=1 Tax=Neorhizobium alkalisoli TaxID=528178 RepID=UPI000CF87CB5|nr:YXWGXW repeat-containing protein [Neorhizobium alkalisoli]
MRTRRSFLIGLLTAAVATITNITQIADAQAQQDSGTLRFPVRRRPPPPRPRLERVPSPRRGYRWVRGRWVWSARRGRWVWIRGRWLRRR